MKKVKICLLFIVDLEVVEKERTFST